MRDRKEYHKQYNKIHKEDRKEWFKQYRLNNPEKEQERYRQWAEDHREQRNENNRQYFKTEKGKAARRRIKSNRRDLGFNPLNEYFDGSEAHHINQNDVIYILKELHQSIRHCLKTGLNMKKINQLAMENLR